MTDSALTKTAASSAASAAAALEARGLRVGYGERQVLHELDVALPAGEITAIVGANACGKSTLLRTLARLLPSSAGEVFVQGRPLADFGRKELARTLGFLPQSPLPPEGVNVGELVLRGRFPHRGLGLRASAHDHERAEWAMQATDVLQLQHRPLDTLSGGQRQRAWIAMALAQDTPILLLDEPTTFLDIGHQLEVLNLLRDLNREAERTIVMVLHDLNQAARYAGHVIGMTGGRVHAAGPPSDVIDPDFVQAVLGVDAIVVPDPVTGTPMAVPK